MSEKQRKRNDSAFKHTAMRLAEGSEKGDSTVEGELVFVHGHDRVLVQEHRCGPLADR